MHNLTRKQRKIKLDDHLIATLSDYDLLIVPGGYATGDDSPVQSLANNTSSPFMELIKKFAHLPPVTEQFPRVILYDFPRFWFQHATSSYLLVLRILYLSP